MDAEAVRAALGDAEKFLYLDLEIDITVQLASLYLKNNNENNSNSTIAASLIIIHHIIHHHSS